MSETPTLLDGLFPKRDTLAGVTVEEVGPEIAAALQLPPLPNLIPRLEDFIRQYVILPDAAYLPVATWVVATYIADAFDAFPYIALVSPAKRCGKTRVLE